MTLCGIHDMQIIFHCEILIRLGNIFYKKGTETVKAVDIEVGGLTGHCF